MKKVLKKFILEYIYTSFYFVGLTTLLVFLILRKMPDTLYDVHASPTVFFVLSLAFILVGFIGTIAVERRFHKAMIVLGMTTLIPGIVSLIVTRYGVDFLLRYVERVPESGVLIAYYLKYTVPSMISVTIGYLVVGGILIYLSFRSKKRRGH